MKQGTLIVRIMMLVLALGVLAYFGVYLWNTLTATTTTATLYTYTSEARVETTGYFFRDETVLAQQSDLTEVLCAEGEKVGVGDVVARIYANSQGYQVQQQLDEAKATLSSLQYILSRTNESADTMALDDDIVSAFTTLRYSAATGDLSDLSTTTAGLRSMIFRRDYTYNGTDTLNAQIEETEALVSQLTQQASSAYTKVTTPVSGLFSAQVDGYEGVLTLEALEGLTPSGLEQLVDSRGATGQGSAGKIVTNSGWYFSCNLKEEELDGIYAGATVTLRFESSNRDFSAKVTRVSDPEDGKVNVTFFSAQYASLVTGLREQKVSVITGTATGFRVSKRAVRVNEEGTLGVYRVSGAQADWVDIQILWEEDDYYLIAQAEKVDENGNAVTQSTFERASALREGDTVIVKGGSVYDGKVVMD